MRAIHHVLLAMGLTVMNAILVHLVEFLMMEAVFLPVEKENIKIQMVPAKDVIQHVLIAN
ncbi:hypothetical protein X975_08969, partial [Stegodyphus mimosarum]